MNSGSAYFFRGQIAESAGSFANAYNYAKEGAFDVAAHAAAWRIICARKLGDSADESLWLKKLSDIAPSSGQNVAYWLDRLRTDSLSK